MSPIKDFFIDIDRLWAQQDAPAPKVRLSLIGCGALLLQANYARPTKDSDVFETTELTRDTKQRLLALAGAGTPLHARCRMYIDIVANGLPFLPHVPVWRPIPELAGELQHLELAVLDVVDVVVSKLKRFHENDRRDIDAMIQLGRLPHARLVKRFRSAVDTFICDARGPDLPKYIANLNRVEEDMLGVPATEIELPSWL